MKSRSSLVLTEIIIMVLVFSIASALCVNAFVKASELENDANVRDRALFEMQNVIETLKIGEGNVDYSPDSALNFNYDGEDFYVTVSFTDNSYADLWTADVSAYRLDGTVIATLQAAGRIFGEVDE